MVFGSRLSLRGPCLYHRYPAVWLNLFLVADTTIYEFDFVHRLLIGKKLLCYLSRNLFMVKLNSFPAQIFVKTVMFYQPISAF